MVAFDANGGKDNCKLDEGLTLIIDNKKFKLMFLIYRNMKWV